MAQHLNSFFNKDEVLDWDELLSCGLQQGTDIRRKLSESTSTASFGISAATSNKSFSSKQRLEDDDISDDEFGSLQSAVQLMVDEFDEKDDIFQHPFFQSAESSPTATTPTARDAFKMTLDPPYQPVLSGSGLRGGPPAAVAIQPQPSLPTSFPQLRANASKPVEKPIVPAPAPIPSFVPSNPALIATSMVDARTLAPTGLISIGGQAYLLLPMTPPAPLAEGGPPALPPATSQPRRFSQPQLKFIPDASFPPYPTLPDSRKEQAHGFHNIQVLSEKVNSTVEHGYYLSEAVASPEAKGQPPRPSRPVSFPPQEAKPDPKPLCFPTYTYDYGTEVDQQVWDILRKSLRPSS
eukprot:EG_transcript_2408